MKKFFIAWLAYIVLTFIFAALWHLVLFKEVYDALGIFTREKPIITLGILSMILQGMVFAFVYPYFYRGRNYLKNGLLFGLLMGIFMGSNAVLAEAGKNTVSSLSTWIFLEGSFYLLWLGVTGIIIAWIYRTGKS